MKIKLNVSKLKAALLTTDQDDLRTYLGQVFISKNEIVSTDTRLLLVQKHEIDLPAYINGCICIFAIDIKFALNGYKGETIVLEFLDNTEIDKNRAILGKTLVEYDTNWPINWKRAVPTEKFSNIPSQITFDHMLTIKKISDIINPHKKNSSFTGQYFVHHNGENQYIVTFGLDDTYLVGMPLRWSLMKNKLHQRLVPKMPFDVRCVYFDGEID